MDTNTTTTPVVVKIEEITAATPQMAHEDRPTLADLEGFVIAKLVEDKTPATPELIGQIGNPVVASGNLRFYTAERWGNGEWISDKVSRRITRAVKAGLPAEPAAEEGPAAEDKTEEPPAAEPKKTTRRRKAA